MEDITKAYAWKDSLELSKQLVQLCEAFSDVDTNVLVWHLRQAVVDVPATVAADLAANRSANLDPCIKLMAELELVHKIYPGIDTSNAEELLHQLLDRLRSDRFGEREADEPVEVEWEEERAKSEQEPESNQANRPEMATLRVDGLGGQPAITSIDPTQPADHHDGS